MEQGRATLRVVELWTLDRLPIDGGWRFTGGGWRLTDRGRQ